MNRVDLFSVKLRIVSNECVTVRSRGCLSDEVFGDEIRGCDERHPCFGNAPETKEGLHWKPFEDLGGHFDRKIVRHGRDFRSFSRERERER